MIYLYSVSTVHPLAAAVTERREFLGAGMTKRIPAEKDALRVWFALAAAGAYKMVQRHWFSLLFVIYKYNISTKKELIRYFHPSSSNTAYRSAIDCRFQSRPIVTGLIALSR